MPVLSTDLDQLITPGVGTATPQAPAPRRAARLWRRDALDLYRPEHAALVDAAVLARVLTPSPLDLERTLITHLGFNYCFSNRCTGITHCHDCSGYQCWGMNTIGVPVGCTSSFVIAQMCWDAGLFITDDDEALAVPHWAFHGADQGRRDDGSRPNGASGHIVYANLTATGPWAALPNHLPGTLEAMGRAYGVRRGNYWGRGWTGRYRILGLDYVLRRRREPTMIVQQYHYDPTRPTAPPEGKDSTISIADDGLSIEARWDASIDEDLPVSRGLRRWRPRSPLPPGVTMIAVAERRPTSADARPGGVVQLSNGDTRRFHLS